VSDILAIGDMVHVASRRLFPGDLHSHVAGEVTAVEGALFRVVGYTFIYDPASNTYFKHPDLRTRLFSIDDPGRDLTILPRKVEMKTLQYEIVEGRLMLADAKGFSMEVAEFGAAG
jgi:hypothetical protein